MNSINLIGNVGKEIELKYTNSNKPVTAFSLAVRDDFSKDKTHWFNCVAWNKTAETIASYVKKGQQIGITGRLTTRNYEDKQGATRTVTEIVIDSFTFVGKKDEDTAKPTMNNAGFEVVDEDDDDLPF